MAVDNDVPVIDLSGVDEKCIAEQLVQALSTIGFATLTNHGIDSKLIGKAFEQSKYFFQLPLQEKLKRKFQGHESNRGYIPMGSEIFEDTSTETDKKETFDIGRDDEPGFHNDWPSHGFRDVMLLYFQAMDGLQLRLLKLLAQGLELDDPNYFYDRCNDQHENLRLLHYPALQQSSDDIQRGAIHTDFGTLTLLTQDGVGGLRAQRLDGTWVSVPPMSHTIVVNVGDMMQRWTNNVLRATPHQVVGGGPERYSIAFFCNANKDVMLQCLDKCVSEENPARYEPIKAHDYLTMRLTQTIDADKGAQTYT
jgi:isopenicillin N synthase-like dioxygenase